MQKICESCGVLFDISDRKDIVKRQKYCNPNCRSRYYYKNHPDKYKIYFERSKARKLAITPKKIKVCQCGKVVSSERGRKEYCSDECYLRYKYLRENKKRHIRKLSVFNILGGAKCKYCGCDDLNALEINHKNGGGNRARRLSRGGKTGGNSLVDEICSGRLSPDVVEVTCRVCNAWHYITKKIGYDKWKITWNQTFNEAV